MPRKKEPPYVTENTVFASRLRQVMAERGETQTSLAHRITETFSKIQRQSIAQYMSGQSNPDTDRLTALSMTLDVSADYLLGLSEQENSDMDFRAACDYTGLSEAAMKRLLPLKETSHPALTECKNRLFAAGELYSMLVCMADAAHYAARYREAMEKYPDTVLFDSQPEEDFSFHRYKAVQAFERLLDGILGTKELYDTSDALRKAWEESGETVDDFMRRLTEHGEHSED